MKRLLIDIYDDARHWLLFRISRRYRDGVNRLLDDLGLLKGENN